MRNNSINKADLNLGALNTLLFGVVAVTIYFKIDLQDPFNSPKMWILFLISAWLFGLLLTFISLVRTNKILKHLTLFLLIFNLVMFVGAIYTDNTTTAFFGETQRRNGFLTYFCMSIVLLSSAILIRLNSINRLFLAAFSTGLILGIYGFMQHNGKDFVQWVNSYNSVIGTLGNPNFAAALMAVISTLVFGVVINNSFTRMYRALSSALILLLLLVTYFSQAKQGLVTMFVGIGLLTAIYIHSKSKKLLLLFVTGGSLFSLFGILGMLQIGPLTQLLYKPSVSVRGYYWRAGINMLRDNPLLGVGIDRYGAYFKQYRESGYSLSYGMELTSTNAHNTFIQFFATGGLPLGISYLLLLFLIFYIGVKGLIQSTGNERLKLGSIFSAWIAFHSQSLVSIDNIGISIWGFLLAGAIVGLSSDVIKNNKQTEFQKKSIQASESKKIIQPMLSILFLIPVIILVSLLHRGENDMYKLRGSLNPAPGADNKMFKDYAYETLSNPFLNDFSKLEVAISLGKAGYPKEAIEIIESVYSADPRSLDALALLASTREQVKDVTKAIEYRNNIAGLDPWNAENYLQLGRLYKSIGDTGNMEVILSKILSFAPNSDQGKLAKAEFTLSE